MVLKNCIFCNFAKIAKKSRHLIVNDTAKFVNGNGIQYFISMNIEQIF